MPEIYTLPNNELISEPGFYRLPLERHHNQPCDGVSVTSGILRSMVINGPSYVWARHSMNPNRLPFKESDALRFGRAMAYLVELGQEGALDHLIVIPSAAPQMTTRQKFDMLQAGEDIPTGPPSRPTTQQIEKYIAGEATPAGKKSVEFWLAIDDDPRTYVSETEWAMLCDMYAVLSKDKAAMAVMGGHAEISMAYKDEDTGIWVLARPDTVSFDGACSDYKKMAPAGMPFDGWTVDMRIDKFNYYQQMALASGALERLIGKPDSVGLVFQSDEKPHDVILRAVGDEELSIGHFQNRQALQRFKECLDSGDWPGPEHIGTYRMNKSRYERLIEEMQIAGKAP